MKIVKEKLTVEDATSRRKSAYFFLALQAGRRFGSLYSVVRRLLEGVHQVLQSQPRRIHTTGAPAYVFQVRYSGSEEKFSFNVQNICLTHETVLPVSTPSRVHGVIKVPLSFRNTAVCNSIARIRFGNRISRGEEFFPPPPPIWTVTWRKLVAVGR